MLLGQNLTSLRAFISRGPSLWTARGESLEKRNGQGSIKVHSHDESDSQDQSNSQQ